MKRTISEKQSAYQEKCNPIKLLVTMGIVVLAS